ncbi:helix-turn-helix transcriptional regulator [Brevibacillus humidisoli]|uniref:helix-turn-helix domain-containing protein n=1 Tax=Brevibacillus humidisoli TaxID=2895522 RepID=UPI001E5547CA|nr:helix-turn-helix transcriptional regulator [Brevibacillus humidisoli]UFJ43041.1 helix-turn-helix transcriptional regulator [Brevibacillus humidisoli]
MMGTRTLTTIRSEIEKSMRAKGYTLTKLSERTGIHSGHLSEIFNGKPRRAITIKHLDAMAKALGHEPGWLYELYPEECITEESVSRPRVVPYLVRCAELGRKDCILAIVPLLLENPKNVSILFSVAEQLFQRGKQQESALFYQLVTENEKDSYVDHFVISHYRLFRISQGTDLEETWKAVIRFEPFCNRLPENDQLDALLQLANAYYMFQKWGELATYADKLRELATIVYKDQLLKGKRNKVDDSFQTERHLVVYYGQGFLMKGLALQMQGLYEEAKKYVQQYADLGWFELLDDTGKKEVEKFKVWAKANSYTLDLLMGNIEVLPEYINLLRNHPAEVPAGLLTLVESASKHDYSIDDLLRCFATEIERLREGQNPIEIGRHYQFRYYKARYELKRGRLINAIEDALHCIDLSVKLKHHKELLDLIMGSVAKDANMDKA